MDFIKKLKLIERIDGMISRKSTGSPAELAQKIGVSERTLYNIIAIMKNLGAPIFYSSSRMSYCYSGTVNFSYVFNVDEEEPEKTTDTNSWVEPEESPVKKLHREDPPFRSASNYGSSF